MQGVRADIVWWLSAPMLLRCVGTIAFVVASEWRDNRDAQDNLHVMICGDAVRVPA
jgi:hypothetical protein